MSKENAGLGTVMSRREALKRIGLATAIGVVGGAGGIAAAGATAEVRGDRSFPQVRAHLRAKPGASGRFRAGADEIAFKDGHLITGVEGELDGEPVFVSLGRFNHDIPYRNGQGEIVYPNPVFGPQELPPGVRHEDLHHTFSPELLHELVTPFRIADTLDSGFLRRRKQRINTSIVNRSGRIQINTENGETKFQVTDPNEPVLLNFEHFGNKVDARETNYRIGEKARQNDCLVITFDAPNQGASDPLTKRQMKDLRDGNGDMDEIGKTYLRIIKSMGIKVIDVSGSSMGSRLAMSVARQAANEEFGIKVRNVILNEPTGVDEQDVSLGEFFDRNSAELKASALMHSNPLDVYLYESFGLDRSGFERNLEGAWIAASLLGDDPWLLYTRALGKSTVERSVWQILATQPDAHVTFINGGASQLSPKDQVHRIVNKLRDELDPNRTNWVLGRRVSAIIKPGVGHLAEAQPQSIGSRLREIRTIPLSDTPPPNYSKAA